MAQTAAEVDVSHVCKLTRVARKQAIVNHHARAVELYERALAAAEALGQPDCLIVARLRYWCLIQRYRIAAADAPPGEDDATTAGRLTLLTRRLTLLMNEHLPAVLDTLERRRAAGTLLPGCCRTHEMAWCEDTALAELRVLGNGPNDDVRLGVLHVGVKVCVDTARLAVKMSVALLETNTSEPLLARCLTAIEHALQLALELARDNTATSRLAVSGVLLLDEVRKRILPCMRPEVSCHARVLAAWREWESSGLLHMLCIEVAREVNDTDRHREQMLAEAQAAKDAAVPLRACALPSCGAVEAHVAHFKKCGACGAVVYCSKAHQTEHWPAHKAACKAARKAAAEGGASQDA